MKPGLKNLHFDAAHWALLPRRQLRPRVVRSRPQVDAVTGRDSGHGKEAEVHGFLSLAIAVVRGATAAGLILLLLLVQARAFWAFEAHVVNVTAEIHQINAPTAAPPGGAVPEGQEIVLTFNDPSDPILSIHFVTNGNNLTCDSEQFVGGGQIIIIATTTLQAIACDPEDHQSIPIVELYTVEPSLGPQSFLVDEETSNPLFPPEEGSISSEPPLFPAVPTTTPTTTLPLLDFPAFPPLPTSTPTTTPELPELPPIPDFFDDFPVPSTTPTSTFPELVPIPSTPTSTPPEPPPPPEPPDIDLDKPQPPDLPIPPQPPDLPEPPDLTDTLKPPEPPDLPEPPEPPSFPEL